MFISDVGSSKKTLSGKEYAVPPAKILIWLYDGM